jgi:hypothetical protein
VELRETLPWLEELSLGTTKGLLEQLAADLPHLDIRTVLGKLNQIETVLEYELKARMFFVLDVSDTGRYNNLLLAGERFKDNWPRSNGELIEAGNCFSVACYTGCVCHLMRSLEYALRAFEAALKITAPPPGPGNTWGNILGRIEVKKGKGNTKPSPEWIADAAFYDDCLSFFWAVKSACRDKTFHVESSYDKSSAKPLFDCTVAILSKISEHLNEIK